MARTSAWLLPSPHTDGLHFAVRTLQGQGETWANVLRWKPKERTTEAVDAALLPSGIKTIAWNGINAAKPLQFAACCADAVHIIDLDNKEHPRRIQASYSQSSSDHAGALGAGIAWAGASDQHVVFSQGGSVRAIDAETGSNLWTLASEASMDWKTGIPLSATVASMAKVSKNEVVVGWTDTDDTLCCIRRLDLRTRPDLAGHTAAKHVISFGTSGVHGLCCSTLEPHLAASYSFNPATGGIYIWDLRKMHEKSKPLGQLRAESTLLFDATDKTSVSRSPVGLEWSPTKAETLLALTGSGRSAADGDIMNAHVCRFWKDHSRAAVAEDGRSIDKCSIDKCRSSGSACLVRFPSAGAAPPKIIAASWAHASSPGVVLSLSDGGSVVASVQRCPSQAAWHPRGGGVVVRQWQKEPVIHVKPLDAAAAPAVVTADSSMASVDICSLMCHRAEAYNYGVERLSYDEYSRITRSTGGQTPTAEALAAAWQWAKVIDTDGDAEQEGYGETKVVGKEWNGAQELLHLDGPAAEEQTIEPVQGIYAYVSDGRKRALQALGFPEQESSQPAGDASQVLVDEVVRRILRAIIWFQFERAAVECESLEPFCGQSARTFLAQLVLVMYAAACLLPRASDNRGGDREDDETRAHAFRSALQGALNFHWQDIPLATTLRLALQFVEVVVTSCGSAQAAMKPTMVMTGVDAGMEAPTSSLLFQDRVRALLPHSSSLIDESTMPGSLGFRCAMALRFLPEEALFDVLKSATEESLRYGLLDGLCLFGLGGAADTSPLLAGALQDLVQASPLPPPPPVAGQLMSGDAIIHRTMARISSAGSSNRLIARDQASAQDDGASLIRAYVEHTGDVQTAALWLCHAAHLAKPPLSLRRFLVQYAALLARWQLHRERARLHSLLAARLPRTLDEAPVFANSRSPMVYCYFCNAPLSGSLKPDMLGRDVDLILRRCPGNGCGKPTPSCSVCLLPIFVVRSQREGPADRNTKACVSLAPKAALAVDDWVAWCQGCHHGGHVGHLEQWFAKHDECPVAGCDCKCGLY